MAKITNEPARNICTATRQSFRMSHISFCLSVFFQRSLFKRCAVHRAAWLWKKLSCRASLAIAFAEETNPDKYCPWFVVISRSVSGIGVPLVQFNEPLQNQTL
jgi:hypothetical protein